LAFFAGAVVRQSTLHETDLERLARLEIFSWLTTAEIGSLGASLAMSNFKRGEVIFRDPAAPNGARVLVSGIARVTCLNGNHERVTVSLIARGPLPELPTRSMSRFDFRCEAYRKCRVGTLDWDGFEEVTPNGREAVFNRFHQSDLKYWYRLVRRTSGFFNLDLHERIALTMLDLSEDFGIADARGTLLGISISQADIASMVGASRPRINEHLARMERDHILIPVGRRFIVITDKLRIRHPRQ
jgi:CRP-like cAMP-binding protein